MQKLLAAAMIAMLTASPAVAASKKASPEKAAEETAAAVDEDDDPEADAKLEAMKKLAKKKKCVDVVMHKEVLPFFGKENTVRASQEITVEWERDDIVSGRAEVLDTHSRCTEVVGSLVVMCTTVTALCYHEKPKNPDKGETLSMIEKQRAAAKAVSDKAAENEARREKAAGKAD